VREFEALLHAVLEAPEDDTPRLVLADYLEESGHPAWAARAAYIRLQIEEARLPWDHPRRAEWYPAMVRLKQHFQDEWDVALAHHTTRIQAERRRGFVAELVGEITELDALPQQAWAMAPITRISVLMDQQPPSAPVSTNINNFWHRPELQRVRELVFVAYRPTTITSYAPFAALMSPAPESPPPEPRPSPPVSSMATYLSQLFRGPLATIPLRQFGLRQFQFHSEDLLEILFAVRDSATLQQLETLQLVGHRFATPVIHLLASFPWPKTFKSIDLRDNWLDSDDLAWLQDQMALRGIHLRQ